MKKIYTYFAIVSILCLSLKISSCTDGFAEMNTHPEDIAAVTPDQLLVRTQSEWMRGGRAWQLWDNQFSWMQYGAPTWGMGGAQSWINKWQWRPGNTNPMYNEFVEMGTYVTIIQVLAEQDPRFSNIAQMARLTLIAKGIHASDMQGSLVWTEGWLARRGYTDSESMRPRFDTQQELVVIWDRELREIIQTLQNNMNDPSQVDPRGNDRAFAGNTQQWIRAANGIRLRLASRLWNEQPATAIAIATEVLAPANAANVFGSNADSFIFWHNRDFLFNAEWHSVHDLTAASRTIMDYLQRNQDPRKRIFFRPNNLTPELIWEHNLAILDGGFGTTPAYNPFNMIPMTTTRFEGMSMSHDRRLILGGPPANTFTDMDVVPHRSNFPDDAAFEAAALDFMTNFDWREEELGWDRNQWQGGVAFRRPASHPQARLWAGHVSIDGVPGNGGIWMPVMTFADFSLLAAEFVLREGIPSIRTAQQWYEVGVRASLDHYNDMGRFGDVIGFVPMTEDEINTFLNMPDIAWNPAIALYQIYAQTYVEHFRNIDEMHAFWKRTNFPNTNSPIITFEPMYVGGVLSTIPRRARFTAPNPGVANYANIMRRFEQMMQDPKFGELNNEFGRVWWDAP